MEPAAARRIRELNDELLKAVDRVERLAIGGESADAPAVRRALSDLRRRLGAHVVVDGELVLDAASRAGGAPAGVVGRLSREHDELLALALELERGRRPVEGFAELALCLRRHVALELRLLVVPSDPASHPLALVPAWRADELYERAGGPAAEWPEKWLG